MKNLNLKCDLVVNDLNKGLLGFNSFGNKKRQDVQLKREAIQFVKYLKKNACGTFIEKVKELL